jgi:endonuclease YncB( thermonuclease family)
MLTAALLAIFVGVSDGDTVTALTAGKEQMKIRLSGIDAPESRQPFGQRSKQSLSNLVYGKEVDLTCGKVDRYKRHICLIRVDGRDANLEQIKQGMAWHYKAYAREQPTAERDLYAAEEMRAKNASMGLWREPDPVPPWDWRKQQRKN